MSSPDEVSFRGTNFGSESGRHSEGRRFGHGFPRGHGLGPDERLGRSSEDSTCFPVSQTFQYDSWLDSEEMEGRSVIWGCEGRPGTPVDEKGDSLDLVPQMTVEGTRFGQHVVNREAWAIHRHPSPQTCTPEPLGIWGDTDAGTSRRGTRSLTSVEGKQYSASQLHPGGLGQGRGWVTPRRGTPSGLLTGDDSQYTCSDYESSDEMGDIQMMRVTICLKEGGQARSSSLTELEDPARHTNVHGREGYVQVSPSLLATAPRGHSSGIEKQAAGDLESSLLKKKPSMVWGKEGSRPSYQVAAHGAAAGPAAGAASATATATATTASPAAPAPAPSGALHKTCLRRKQAQEKPTQWDASRGPLGRTFPPWGQRLKSAPVEPATFPPISGVALLGKASKCSLPSGPKECKKSVVRRTRETQAGAKEDNEQTRDPGLQAQPLHNIYPGRSVLCEGPTHRAEQACGCVHREETTSGDASTRAPQVPVPGSPQLLSLSQRSVRPRGPFSAGDQEALVHLPFSAGERQYPASVSPGCQQCLLLQNEIEELKERLAVMQALSEKFQDL